MGEEEEAKGKSQAAMDVFRYQEFQVFIKAELRNRIFQCALYISL